MNGGRLAQQRLTQALWAYERAASLARLLAVRPAQDLQDARWLALAFRAHVCGYRPEAAGDDCLLWARQEVARFAREHPADHAQAVRTAP